MKPRRALEVLLVILMVLVILITVFNGVLFELVEGIVNDK